jgi:hypothetical protein
MKYPLDSGLRRNDEKAPGSLHYGTYANIKAIWYYLNFPELGSGLLQLEAVGPEVV